jgi:hypothetical protein
MTEPVHDFLPITPDDRVRFNKAADLLGVAHDRRENFVGTIGALVYTARLKSRLSSELKDVDDHLVAAAKAVRSAFTAVAQLTPRQKAQLGAIITGLDARLYWLPVGLPFEVQDNIAPALIEAVDAALSEFVGRSPHAASGKRGKPTGAKAQWAMHDFMLQLWDMTRLYGDVTLSNKGGQAAGSIVAMLGILKPMLPKQFFPGILDHSFLRKVQKSLPRSPAYEAVLELRQLGRADV